MGEVEGEGEGMAEGEGVEGAEVGLDGEMGVREGANEGVTDEGADGLVEGADEGVLGTEEGAEGFVGVVGAFGAVGAVGGGEGATGAVGGGDGNTTEGGMALDGAVGAKEALQVFGTMFEMPTVPWSTLNTVYQFLIKVRPKVKAVALLPVDWKPEVQVLEVESGFGHKYCEPVSVMLTTAPEPSVNPKVMLGYVLASTDKK